MAPDPLRARAEARGRNSPSTSLALKVTTIVYTPPPPPLSEIPGSAPDYLYLLLREENNAIGFKLFRYFIFVQLK